MQRQAIDLLHVKIMTDQNMTLMGHQRHDWMILLNTTIVATLIMQYFCTNEQGDHTLPELFAQVPFHYSLASDEEELGTYKELTTDYQRFRRISPLRIWLSRHRDFLNKSWLKLSYSLLLAQSTLLTNEEKL